MDLALAKNKYRYDINDKILNSYRNPDKHFIVNDGDHKIKPVILRIDKIEEANYKLFNTEYTGIPDWHLMDNFGLPAEEQMYFRHEMPKKLIELERQVVRDLDAKNADNKTERVTAQKIIHEINRRIEFDRKYFEYEIEQIKKYWWYRLYGRWIMINGKPTYIDGWHDMYCSWWYLGDAGYPDYRDADRRSYLYYKYAYTTTHTFKDLDKEGFAIPNEKGRYEMIDTGHRVCYGAIIPKKRREGATNMALLINYEIVSRTIGNDVLGGIQADGENTSKSHYVTKLIPAWKKMPFFYKPMWGGNNVPLSGIKFTLPTSMAYGDELESQISYATTADGSFYDHTKLYAYLGDEWGKVPHVDIHEAVWGRVKPALAQGAGAKIVGFALLPSTVEEMEGLNAEKYYDLCESSNFYRRIHLSGQTHSGVFRKFIKAWDGLEGFIDEYGDSVIETPTPRQRDYIRRDYGAREYIQGTRDSLGADRTYVSKKALRTFKKRYPVSYEECFTGSSGDIGFDTQILDEKLMELRTDASLYTTGRFEWVGGEKDSTVIFIEDKQNGHWEVDTLFIQEATNNKITSKVYDSLSSEYVLSYMPSAEVVDRCTIGMDTFEFSMKSEFSIRRDKDKMSDGGITVLRNRDKIIDTDEKDVYEWQTYKFIAVYRYRTPREEDFVEEGIKAAVYYGGLINSERNKSQVNRICRERGYLGYLKHEVDEVTGKIAEQAGYHMNAENKKKGFSMFRDYIDMRGHATNLPLLLTEAKEIQNIEQLKNFDALSSGIGALLGTTSVHDAILKKEMQILDQYKFEDFFETYNR